MVEHGAGADLLIHEVICGDKENSPDPAQYERIIAHHTTPQQAGDIFAKAQPRLAAYSHVILLAGANSETLELQTRETYDGPLLVGEDLTRITIGDESTIERLN